MTHTPRLRAVYLIVATLAGIAVPSSVAFERSERTLQQEGGPVYVAYYWRVRPGKLADYNTYIKGTAERIDEDARKAGAFIDVTTVLADETPDGPRPDWTHLRMFKLATMDHVARLSSALDAATLRVVPDEAERKANMARAADMRDFVRREVWRTLH
jgi:hypothetical protein